MRTPVSSLVLSLLLAACGGKVAVDSIEDPTPTCADICTKSAAACGGTAEDCTSSCEKSGKLFSALCPDAWDAFLVCVANDPAAECQTSSACDAEITALTTCVATQCASDPAACLQP